MRDVDGEGRAPGAGGNPGEQEPSATAPVQSEAGSYDADDPDRPQWAFDTKLEAEYHYNHEDGTYAFTVLKGRRSDGGKTFLNGQKIEGGFGALDMARHDDPRGFYAYPGIEHFRKGKADQPGLLYRLDELARAMAARPRDPIFICEGEKDADTLWSKGLIATSNSDGALKWLPVFNARFAGRDLVVLIDKDDRGRERGAILQRQLLPRAKSLKVVELPGLPTHGDVTDWLSGGRTIADLWKAVADAPQTRAHELFERDEDGKAYRSIDNAKLAVALLGATVSYDEFACRYLVNGLDDFGPVLDDAALTRMRLLVERRWGLVFGKERWCDIVTDHARDQSFHPVREYLDGLTWDRRQRIDRWLPEYGGAEDSEYVHAVGSITLIAAVRRVRTPGCKFDEMLVLESGQGTGKSTALSILAGNEDWFADDLPADAESKIVMERIAGRWIVELAELKGMRRGAVEQVKSMLSRRVDKARLAYGRMTTEQPRQCVFFGTTNDSEYLRDMTGNRRFWPVRIGEFNLKALAKDRDQLWAEAAHREAQGDPIRLPEHLWAIAGQHQADRELGDPFFEVLSSRLDGLQGKVRASDIWEAIGLSNPRDRTQDHNVRLNAAMQKLGWRRPKSKLRFDGKPQHAWLNGEPGLSSDAYGEVSRSTVLGFDEADGRPM